MKNLITLTDEQLITLFNEGNNHAMEVLVNRHKVHIFTSIYAHSPAVWPMTSTTRWRRFSWACNCSAAKSVIKNPRNCSN